LVALLLHDIGIGSIVRAIRCYASSGACIGSGIRAGHFLGLVAIRVGCCSALPAIIALIFDINTGLAFAVGILPLVALPLAPIRRARIPSLVIGAIAGISLVVGSCSVGTPSLLSLVLGNAHNPPGSLEIFVLLNANPAGVQGAGGYRAATRATLNHPVRHEMCNNASCRDRRVSMPVSRAGPPPTPGPGLGSRSRLGLWPGVVDHVLDQDMGIDVEVRNGSGMITRVGAVLRVRARRFRLPYLAPLALLHRACSG
jgi:hypothetical protein